MKLSTIPDLTDEEAKAAVLAWDKNAYDTKVGGIWIVNTGTPRVDTGEVSRGPKSDHGSSRNRAQAWREAVDILVLSLFDESTHLWMCHTCKRIRTTAQMARSKKCTDCSRS